MLTEAFTFKGDKGTALSAMIWLPDGEPRQILQIAHGMTEHIGCYEGFAQEMTAQGIIVAGFDLRGHGKNAGNPQIASLGDGGWEASIVDMHLFFTYLEKRFSELPHYMLGFSLGSFLLREYLSRYPEEIAGAVIMGTGYQPALVLSIMMAIVKTQIRKAGFDQTTDLVKQLSFGTYNQKFKPNRTIADWLCADKTQLDEYLADPLVRKDISAGLFWQLLDSMKRTGKADACASWKKEMPVLLLSGDKDPVGDAGKGVKAVKQQLEKNGLQHVTMHLLPDARHDVLHEGANGAAKEARKVIKEWIK